MRFAYPVSLDVEGRVCTVLGGGKLAESKVEDLLRAGARVAVFSEEVTTRLGALATAGDINLTRRDYRPGDLKGAFLAIAATEDGAPNASAYREAEAEGVMFNAVDDVDHCHFAAPAIVRRGDLALAISTAGKAPALAKRLRIRLSDQFGPEFGDLVDLLGEVRSETSARSRLDFDSWAERWQLALDHDLLGLLRDGRREEAKEVIRSAVETGRPVARLAAAGMGGSNGSSSGGRVAIVGAGPGDPGLITVRGRHLVDSADIVVCDRLVHPDLVDGKKVIYVGKEPGRHYARQGDINRLLVDLARTGRLVVRLKGGDPFVFGRGGEEVEALVAAGIDHEVVPAPTSAIAALGAAGIPVTDRRFSSSFAVVTGHCAGEGTVDWGSLATAVDTIVILMGLGKLGELSRELIAAGREQSCPVALVENGTHEKQRTVVTTLSDCVDAATRTGLGSPTVIVVGEVVTLCESSRGAETTKKGDPSPSLSDSSRVT